MTTLKTIVTSILLFVLSASSSAFGIDFKGQCTQGTAVKEFTALDPATHYGKFAQLNLGGATVWVSDLGTKVLMMYQGNGQAYTEVPSEAFRSGVPLKLGIEPSGEPFTECSLTLLGN